MKRVIGSMLAALGGSFALFLTVGFALGTRAQNYEAWWISLPLGFPLVWTLFGLAWATGTKRRVRPVVGVLISLGALEYAGFFAYATLGISRQVSRSASLLAGAAYLALFPLWLLALLFAAIAWALLRGQNLRGVRSIFLGITTAWLAAWLGFWGVWFPRMGNIRLLTPQSWLIHAFFWLPALLTLVFALTLRRGGSSGEQDG